MAGEDNVKIPKFDGKNYGLWKRHVLVVLRSRKLQDTVVTPVTVTGADGTQKIEPKFDPELDVRTQAILFGAMEQSVIQKVISCDTAYAIWERLSQVYENKSPANVGKIFEQYYSYAKDPKDDMSTHISKVEALAIQLEQVGEKQSEVSIMSKLLHSLPSEYGALKEAWDSVHPGLQTRSNLTARMLAHDNSSYAGKSDTPKDVALFTKAGNRQQGNKGDRMKKVKCYNCGQLGHFKRDCRAKSKGGSEEHATSVALVMKIGEHSDKWVIDSGSGRHTCCRRDWFSSFKDSEEKLQVANEDWVQAAGEGSVKILCQVGSRHEEVELKDVLYIPEMSFNLFSTGQAAKNGATTVIDQKGCRIIHNKRVLAVGVFDKSIGVSFLKAKVHAGVALLVSTRRTLDDWHQSLGHVDPQVITQMITNKTVEGLEVIQDKPTGCMNCPEGKATRAPHTMNSSVAPATVGDQVDMDLVGSISQESLGGARYLLVASDRYSGYTWVKALKTKDMVCAALQEFVAFFEVASGYKIKNILTDNGSEFSNAGVRILMAVEHIEMRHSAPYTPQQNGAAERRNRVVVETARTILLQSGLPKELWGEAACTAAYLRNRVPRRGYKATPYELFVGRKPFVGHLVPFGKPVQSLINDRRLGKFDSRTEPAFIVGFTDRTNTYRLYLPEKKDVKISSDVIFRGHSKALVETDQNRSSEDTVISDLNIGKVTDGPREEVVIDFSGFGNQEPGQISQSTLSVLGDQARERPVDTFFKELDAGLEVNQAPEAGPSASQSAENIFHTCAGEASGSIDITSPSYSQLTVAGEGPEQQVENQPMSSTRMYPSLEEVECPFRGTSIPRSPQKPRGPTILLSRNETQVAQEPKTFQEAVTGPNQGKWKQAIASELLAHQKNKTWMVVKRPDTGTMLSTRWIFTQKRNSAGAVERYKARLVVRGFEQIHGVNYGETFSPVARMESIRILLAIAAAKGMSIERFDVSTAFLNGTLEEQILMEPPEGVRIQEDQCLKLIKSLYGLKQAPRVWSSLFDKTIQDLGFTATVSDPCLYVNRKLGCYLAIYVDDGLLVGPDSRVCLSVIEQLNRAFETVRVTGDIFLGIRITRTRNGLHLGQGRYVSDLLESFKLQDCLPVSTPLVDTKILFKENSGENVQAPYRSAIGCLQYMAHATRPDILFASTLLSRFNENPKKVHWEAVKRTIKYLSGTKDLGLVFTGPHKEISIEAYSDADYGNGDENERRSTTGLVITLCGSLIIFGSRQQSAIAQSSTESEFIAANDATKELCWLVALLQELGVTHTMPKLRIDNKSTIALIKNHDVKRRSKHIEIKYHMIRLKYKERLFDLEHVCTEDQIADFLTKRLGSPQMIRLLNLAQMGKLIVEEQGSSHGRDRGGVLGKTISSLSRLVARTPSG